jgi:hypothetical protein
MSDNLKKERWLKPWQLIFLSVYLDDRARKEHSAVLRAFLHTISYILINALLSNHPVIRIEHGREQAEAFLEDVYRGIK